MVCNSTAHRSPPSTHTCSFFVRCDSARVTTPSARQDPQLSTTRAGSKLGYDYASTPYVGRSTFPRRRLSTLCLADVQHSTQRYFGPGSLIPDACLHRSFRILPPRGRGAPGRGVIDRRPPTASRGPATGWPVRTLTREYGFLFLTPSFSPCTTLPPHFSVPSYCSFRTGDLSPRRSCVLQDLFLVFLIVDEEQTLEVRPSQSSTSQCRKYGCQGLLVWSFSSSSDSCPLFPISTGSATRSG
ncbi:hypothetical protein K438DRAFT_1849647 [Mycena galopus ATCC 62051]|nr:hypothetical protein K438DRAFT_1849647 [Mycena galopus ATCC 62051]